MKRSASVSICTYSSVHHNTLYKHRVTPLHVYFIHVKCRNNTFTECLPVFQSNFWQFEAQRGGGCQENKHKSALASLPENQSAEKKPWHPKINTLLPTETHMIYINHLNTHHQLIIGRVLMDILDPNTLTKRDIYGTYYRLMRGIF